MSDQSSTNVWDDSQDLLGRRHVANYLTNYMIKRYSAKSSEKGFVLAVDAEWGFGKTFLLQNWCDDLIQTGYIATYFDAWKNDFTPEPLIAFIAELNTALSPQFKKIPAATKIFKKARGNISRLWKPLGLAAAGAGLKIATGISIDTLRNTLSGADALLTNDFQENLPTKENVAKGLEKAFEATLKQHESKKESIEAFRSSMALLIETLSKSQIELPLFIFVDELDRCRPNYAIELLEGIKHLFGIPGIYFIVATNIDQLGESTKAIYGPNFNGRRYLKRFFDMEYSLPKVDGIHFSQNLFEKIAPPTTAIVTGLDKTTPNPEQISIHNIFYIYANYFDRGLRDQEQIIRIIEAAFLTIKDTPVHIHYLFFLAMLYHRSPSIYEAVIKTKSLGEKTGYQELDLDLTKGIFQTIKRSTDPYEREQRLANHQIDTIASLYLKVSNSNLIDLSNEEGNIFEFPNNLKKSLAHELGGSYRSNTYYPPSTKRYPDIIRQAGGFVTPVKRDESS